MYLESGTLLISHPKMPDPRFGQTVLLLTQHSPQGAFALCLNRQTTHDINKLGEELKIGKPLPFPIHWGGPVHPSSVWMVHTPEWHTDQTLNVNEHWKITSSEAMFHHLADGDAPRQFIICYGFASWGPKQLEAELAGEPPYATGSSWVTLPDAPATMILDMPMEKMWHKTTAMAATVAVNTWF